MPEEFTIGEVIEIAEYALSTLKTQINSSSGDNDTLASSIILKKGGHLERLGDAVRWLETTAKNNACDVCEDLYSFLRKHGRAGWPTAMF